MIYLNNNVTFVTISGNSVYETSNDNREIVYIYNSSSNTVVGNTFKGYANYNGIYLDASDDNIISGNRITVCGQYGINISNSTCDKNIVTSNQLLGNTVGALNDSGTSTTVANNITV